jgi:hypothetical protein
MTKKQFLIWIVQIVLFACLGALQFVTPNSGGQQDGFAKTLCLFIYQNRLVISITLGLIFAIITGWKTLFYPRKRAKEIRQRIMQAMLDELFDGDKNNYRITIFKNANLFRRLKIYRIQIKECFKCWRRGEKIIHPKRGKYVYVWERLGTEHTNSKTFFYYDSETAKTCQGVAGAVMQGLSGIIVPDLPNLENIDLSTVNLNNNRSTTTRVVREYMREGYVNDFEALKRINKKARHIYGNILDNGEPKGVLVIDSFLENSFLSEAVISRLTYYAIIVGATM